MPKVRVFNKHHFPAGSKEVIKIADLEILVIQHEGGLAAVQARCPHAGAPLNEGAVCNGRIVCPWHMGTFDLRTGELLEPPPMGPLKCYAVEVDGEDVFVDTDSLPAATRELNSVSQDATFLLVGAGAAGTMAAVTLRARGFAGRVIMVDPVPEEPVDRTVLSKMALSGEMPLAKAKLDSLDNLNVERITASVVNMSAARKESLLSNGRRVTFDRALVATGGRPKRLQIAGAEVAHVIRHSDDVKRILDACERSKTAVIIGTGFIGLEAASALIQKGLQVTVVGQEGLPLEKQLGKANATSLMELHVRNGTSFQLGVEVVRIDCDAVVISQGLAGNAPAGRSRDHGSWGQSGTGL